MSIELLASKLRNNKLPVLEITKYGIRLTEKIWIHFNEPYYCLTETDGDEDTAIYMIRYDVDEAIADAKEWMSKK